MDVSGYVSRVRMLIARLLLLVTVLAMPFGMTPAAATPGTHQPMANMPMGHCDRPVSGRDKKSGIAECTMACSAALPAVSAPRSEPPMIVCMPVLPAAASSLNGLHPETATPPPRKS